MFLYVFLPASRSRDKSHSIRLENLRYSDVFMRPELRCSILRTPNPFWEVLWPAPWGEYIFENASKNKNDPERTVLPSFMRWLYPIACVGFFNKCPV